MKLRLPGERNQRRGDGKRFDSSALSRWVPGLCDTIASACAAALQEEEPEVKVKALSWDQHVQNGHVPFRRDCRVCQQQSVKSRPHRKVKHPLAGTLSLDTAGPFPVAKNILIKAYAWLMPSDLPDPPDALPPHEDDEEMGPILDEEEKEDPQQDQDEGAERGQEGEVEVEVKEDEEQEEEGQDVEEEEAGEDERQEDPKLVTHRMAIPMPSKDQKEILSAIQQMYIQLRILGYHVSRLRTDLGGEFRGQALKQWRRSRDIHMTTTAGVSSQANFNGRAERAIQTVNGQAEGS